MNIIDRALGRFSQLPAPQSVQDATIQPQPQTEPSFHLHQELERWIKKQNICVDDVDPLSTAELVQIFVESQSDARYQLTSRAVCLLIGTLNDRFAYSGQGFTNLQTLPPRTIVKALVALSTHFEKAVELITTLKKTLLLQDANHTSNLSKLTLDELSAICSLFYEHMDDKKYDVPGLYKEVATVLKKRFEDLKAALESASFEKLVQLSCYLIEGSQNWENLQLFVKLFGENDALISKLADKMKPYGIIAFEFTCKRGFEKLALELVVQGLDTKKTTARKSTALHIAAAYQLTQVVTRLLASCSADINKLNALGCTPLHYSCITYNIPIQCSY